MPDAGKALIVVGLLIVAVGVVLAVTGGLPGDIAVKRGNFRFYLPLATCLVLSVVLSLILTLWRR